MIALRGLGMPPSGSLVAYGMGRRQYIVVETTQRIYSLPARPILSLKGVERVFRMEGNPMDRLIDLVESSDVIELPYEERENVLASSSRVIVLGPEERVITINEEV